MKAVYKWVQLSDIHFLNNDEGIQTELLRDNLVQYLKEIHDCNALILSGDYRFAPGRVSNPQQCSEYIRKLAESLRLTNEQIIAAPGNHDLTRSDTRTFIVEGFLKKYDVDTGIISDEIQTHLKKDFEFYNNLCKLIPGIRAIKEDDPSHTIIHLDTCNILLLNTALTAYGNQDYGKLIVGTSSVNHALKKRNTDKPTLAVGHHSLSFMDQKEKDSLERLFSSEGVRLYLCGHAHEPDISPMKNGWEITVGCIMQNTRDVMATFVEGTIFDNGTVEVKSHKWDAKERKWFSDDIRNNTWEKLYDECISADPDSEPQQKEEKKDYPFSIAGYTLLGSFGTEGIKYYWEKEGNYIESIALNQRLRNSSNEEDKHISAYTISTSMGCMLAAMNKACRFCETGTRQYYGPLTAADIAFQCIFMAEYDSDCRSYPGIGTNAREFAFMGQGEPGYNYPAIQQAIIMTDYIMGKLGQRVSRYIISTCGIKEFMPTLIKDINSGIFANKVSVHFSLHEIEPIRQIFMPIDRSNDYREFIKCCKSFYDVSNEKIGVGIMLFDRYSFKGEREEYTLTPARLKEILGCLDKEIFRIDLCAVNNTSTGRQSHQMSQEAAQALFDVVETEGFEGKIFSSFGETQQAGCGMLSASTDNMQEPGNSTIKHFNTAVDLIQEAEEYLYDYMQRIK